MSLSRLMFTTWVWKVSICVCVVFVQDALPELSVKRTQDAECEASFCA